MQTALLCRIDSKQNRVKAVSRSRTVPIGRQVKSVAHLISFRTGISTAVAKLQSCARIIMYHGVLGRDRHLLAEQLKYLHRHFLIVPLDRVIQQLQAGASPKDNEVVLTFDDGLRNNATVVYPVLKYLRIPATFFVCPGLIERGQWLWTHAARCRLRLLQENALAALAGQLTATAVTVEGILDWMKTLSANDRRAAEAKIRQATPDFQPTESDREAFDVMDWSDLRSLDPGLITVGSHTVTHPILPTLTPEEIDLEMTASRRQLEAKLDRPVNYFCYPNGSHHRQSWLAAKRIYDAAVTVENGMLTPQNSADLYRLPRIPATRNGALLAWRLHRPGA
jgi:peptidoglycan/xylan/chitin deacetylase (PgdA/CDA1 family)